MQKLGQHFLKNSSVLQRIAQSLELEKNDEVIEIGPGHGELSNHILAIAPEGVHLTVIEKDRLLAAKLYDTLAEKNVDIVNGDALHELAPLIAKFVSSNKRFKLVGNIPYYITGHLLRTMGELTPRPDRSVLLIQKEVALRIAAKPPDMNRLAASVQFWAEPRVLMTVSRRDFSPPPKVDSAVILLQAKASTPLPHDQKAYDQALKALFAQPRKTILNNLQHSLQSREKAEGIFRALAISPNARPQDLSVEQIFAIGKMLTSD